MKGIFSVLVENKDGVLSQISGLFARRGFYIDSLAVGETERHDISSMTIVSTGDQRTVDQIEKLFPDMAANGGSVEIKENLKADSLANFRHTYKTISTTPPMGVTWNWREPLLSQTTAYLKSYGRPVCISFRKYRRIF